MFAAVVVSRGIHYLQTISLLEYSLCYI